MVLCSTRFSRDEEREFRNNLTVLPILKHLDKRSNHKTASSLRYDVPLETHTKCLDLPISHRDNPSYIVTSKYSTGYTTRGKSPMLISKWFKDGIRIISGNSCGELAIWNRLDESVELGFSAHETSVQGFEFNSRGNFAVSVDHGGFVMYWQDNLNSVTKIFAHTDPARDVSFSPTDEKFATCGDDGYIKIWDFELCKNDITLEGHGSEVKCIDWHPTKGLIVSGAKDSQQPVALWDPRTPSSISTIYVHNNTVNDVKWNLRGNLFATCSKDKLVKLYDIRVMKEYASLRGHKGDVISVAFNPVNERTFVTGSLDGSFVFWDTCDVEKPLAVMDNVHDGAVWCLSWHPLGHYLVSSSNDCTNRVWCRNSVGDSLKLYRNISQKSTLELRDYKSNDKSFPGISPATFENKLDPASFSEPMRFSCPEKTVDGLVLNPFTDMACVDTEEEYIYDNSIDFYVN